MDAAKTYPMLDGGDSGQAGTPESAVRHYRMGTVPHLSDGYVPKTFEMEMAGTAATFTNCVTQNDYCFTDYGTLTGTVAQTGTVYVYVETDDVAKTAEIKTAATFAGASHSAPLTEPGPVRRPLYKVVNGMVECDYRPAVFMGQYV
jgi:hypothetical protein